MSALKPTKEICWGCDEEVLHYTKFYSSDGVRTLCNRCKNQPTGTPFHRGGDIIIKPHDYKKMAPHSFRSIPGLIKGID